MGWVGESQLCYQRCHLSCPSLIFRSDITALDSPPSSPRASQIVEEPQVVFESPPNSPPTASARSQIHLKLANFAFASSDSSTQNFHMRQYRDTSTKARGMRKQPVFVKDCPGCRGRHRRHTCGRQPQSRPPVSVEGCAACRGQHRTHTCAKHRFRNAFKARHARPSPRFRAIDSLEDVETPPAKSKFTFANFRFSSTARQTCKSSVKKLTFQPLTTNYSH